MELQVGLLEIRVNLGCLKGLSLIRSPVSCPQSRGLRPAVCPSKSFCCQIKNEFLVFQCMRVKERVREDLECCPAEVGRVSENFFSHSRSCSLSSV